MYTFVNCVARGRPIVFNISRRKNNEGRPPGRWIICMFHVSESSFCASLMFPRFPDGADASVFKSEYERAKTRHGFEPHGANILNNGSNKSENRSDIGIGIRKIILS